MISAKTFKAVWAIIRPHQFYKTLIVFAPALFHGGRALLVLRMDLARIAVAWILASGVVYIFNDIHDLASDRTRPERMKRPLVRGDLSPRAASILGAGILLILLIYLWFLPHTLAPYVVGYLILNFFYTMGLKGETGLQQGMVAVGFWLRLKSGAMPVTPIPLTTWATVFTLGLAYFLSALKYVGRRQEDTASRWLGVGLSGALSLVALTSLCMHRGAEGTLLHPEWPPLLCLVCMHRIGVRAFRDDMRREMAHGFFGDVVILGCLTLFVLILVRGW
jgi:4-hydroxybenzoate polyprenyltransferase